MSKQLLFLIFSWAFVSANAQLTWVKRTNFPDKRDNTYSFSANGKIYFGGGRDQSGNVYGDMWEFNPSTNVWTQKQSFPSGFERYGAKAMVLNGKAYIIAGWKQSGSPLELQDVWEYDPTLNTYNKKKNLPATFTGRYAYVAFTIGNKGYMGLGYGTWRDDFASYDPSTDTWTNLANFPGAARSTASAFATGNYGYVGFGIQSPNSFKDFYQYNPSNNTWTALPAFPGDNRSGSVGFALNNKGYVVGGIDDNLSNSNFVGSEVWEFNPIGNLWTKLPNIPDTLSNSGAAISGNSAYIGLGNKCVNTYAISNNTHSFWEFTSTTGIDNTTENNANTITALLHNDKTFDLYFKEPTIAEGYLVIIDNNGRVVSNTTIPCASEKFKINLYDLADGMYVFRYQSRAFRYSSKFVLMF